ncbi:addiction module protein [Pontiella sp.]|uniref:addiction module protein n=1 Tax=Pontiella sp. TaxID=2837462 RepID=UPI003563DB42
MKMTAEQLITGAMDLPPAMRAFVAEKLIESLDVDPAPEISDAWKETVERRCREMDSGAARMMDADEAFSRAHAVL